MNKPFNPREFMASTLVHGKVFVLSYSAALGAISSRANLETDSITAASSSAQL